MFYERPVQLVRGEGTRLYDAGGTCYLDAYTVAVCLVHRAGGVFIAGEVGFARTGEAMWRSCATAWCPTW